MSFKAIGSGGVDQSSHVLTALTSVCHIACVGQDMAFESLLQRTLNSGDMASMCVHRCHDATPILTRFGLLQSDVFQSARYLIPDKSRVSGWRCVSYKDMDQFRRACLSEFRHIGDLRAECRCALGISIDEGDAPCWPN